MSTRSDARLPVVLLHALPLNASMWDAQARALAARGHPVIAFDQRGFGATPLGTDPPSLEVAADDLARHLDEQNIDRAVLAGCSMGGYLAMAFLRRHRHRVRGLALLATRATADTAEAAAGREAFAEQITDDARREALLARTTPLLVGATTRTRRPATLARVLALAEAADPRAVAWAQRAVAARPDSMELLRTADIPARVVTGEEDELVSPDEAGAMARALPRGSLHTIPAAGHLQPLETPDRITELLIELLDETATDERQGPPPC